MRRNLIVLVLAGLYFAIWLFWPKASFYAAKYFAQQNQLEKAIALYSRAINSDRLETGILASAYFGLAEAKSDKTFLSRGSDEDFYEALQDYSEAINLEPGRLAYYRSRGTVYSYLGAYPEAFSDFEAMGRIEGDKPAWSLVRKGGLQKRLGDYEGALESFRIVKAAWDYQPLMPVNYHMALTYLEQSEYELAIEALNEGMKAQSDFGGAYQFRGCAKANLGKFKEALEDYRYGHELNRDYIDEVSHFPYADYEKRVAEEDLVYLVQVAEGTIESTPIKTKELCMRNWWSSFFDKPRQRSHLLPN